MSTRVQLRYTPDLADALDAAGLAAHALEARPCPLADMPTARGVQVFLVSTAALAESGRPGGSALRALATAAGRRRAPGAIVLVGDAAAARAWRRYVHACTDDAGAAGPLAALVRAALETARLRAALVATRRQASAWQTALAEREAAVRELHQVGIALSTERDASALQDLILCKSRELTAADAGSLYLIETDPAAGHGNGKRRLRFELAQNDSIPTDYRRSTLPLSRSSLAGYVALTGEVLRIDDVYTLPPELPYGFNRAFDERTGYRTRSMLLVPMLNHDGEVVGVIQLINRKRHAGALLVTPEAVAREVIPFDDAAERLLRSFASQAAVALDNQQLLESIQRLFDGFVRASVQAIEARDPTTSGHSQRVAVLSVALAETVNACTEGRLASVEFSPQELRELRYAGLLHDFGKVGVREHVLVKAKKLYDWQLRAIEDRFAYARAVLVAHQSRDDVQYLLEHGVGAYHTTRANRDAALAAALADIDRDLAMVRQANEPTVLEEDCRHHLVEAGARRYADLDGVERPLLDPAETSLLTIPRGSLNEEERREIESHVTHTIRFLDLIPWTKDLRNVARIAGAHHEKLNGRGYPNRLHGEDIPLQSRIMAIVDIYDALTASDRPYKRAVPTEIALRILRQEADGGMLDAGLLDLFVEQRVYEVLGPPREVAPLVERPAVVAETARPGAAAAV